jgi:hypothetical protein
VKADPAEARERLGDLMVAWRSNGSKAFTINFLARGPHAQLCAGHVSLASLSVRACRPRR